MMRGRRHRLAVATANNDFTADLYKALFPEVSSSNVIFSPFSLNALLSMAGVGAMGDTRTEIFNTLKFADHGDNAIGESFHHVLSGLQNAGSPATFTLLTANRIYSHAGYRLNEDFVTKLKQYFLADFEQLDLSTPRKCRKAAAKVNGWAASTTTIKDLISEDALDYSTRLVLVSGIYFKGVWDHPFKPTDTYNAKFRVSRGTCVKVRMMFMGHHFAYGELAELDAEAVALPYEGGRLSMIIILPKTVDGLAKVQASIGSVLQGGRSLVGERLVQSYTVLLHLPKFTIEASIGNLKEVLQTLGMQAMFNEYAADFSGIPEGGGNAGELFVSTVIQKAFIDVKEEGALIAAATWASGRLPSMHVEPITIPFRVDHPFYFQIVDHANGDLVLFSGHCNDPSQ